jgi:hypothetical protein
MGRQLQVLPFRVEKGGEHGMMEFRVPEGVKATEVGEVLRQAGVGSHTVELSDTGGGHTVLVYDDTGGAMRAVRQAAATLGANRLLFYEGTGEFFGPKEGSTRDEAVRFFEDTVSRHHRYPDLIQRAREIVDRETLQREGRRGDGGTTGSPAPSPGGFRAQLPERLRTPGPETAGEAEPQYRVAESSRHPDEVALDPGRLLTPEGAREFEAAERAVLEFSTPQAIEEIRVKAAQAPMRWQTTKGTQRREYSGARVLAGGVVAELQKKGEVHYEGKTISSPLSAAVLTQTIRDPRFETFAFTVSQKSTGRALATRIITSRLPAQSDFVLVDRATLARASRIEARSPGAGNRFLGSHIEKEFGKISKWIDRLAKREGIDPADIAIDTSHNHPSGIANASSSDVKAMGMLRQVDPRVRWGIVLNSGHFSLLEHAPMGYRARMFRIPENLTVAEDMRVGTNLPHPSLGTHIGAPEDLYRVSSQFQANDGVILVFASQRGATRGISSVSGDAAAAGHTLTARGMARLHESGRTRTEEPPLEAMIRGMGRSLFGSQNVFAVYDGTRMDVRTALEEMVSRGILQDAVFEQGTESSRALAPSHRPFGHQRFPGRQTVADPRDVVVNVDEKRGGVKRMRQFQEKERAREQRVTARLTKKLGREPTIEEVDDALNRSPSRPLDELVATAQKFRSGKNWYRKARPVLKKLFGRDEEMFRGLFAATSAHNEVKANLTQALKAYRYITEAQAAGMPLDEIRIENLVPEGEAGFMGAHVQNINRFLHERTLGGMKVGQFFFNLAGSKDSITFDTWMKRVIFGKDNISEADWARGFDLVQQAANRLGWDADQTQAALWASGLVEAGKKPTDFTTELRSRAAEIIEIRRRSGQLTDEEADALLADAERRAGGDRPGARGGDEGAAGRGRPAGRDGEAEPAPRVGEDPPGYRPQKPPAEPNEGTEPVQREPTEASKGRIRPGISVSTTGVPRFKFATKQYGPPLREFFEFMIENQPAAIEHTRRGAMTVAQIRELAAKWGMTVEQYRKMRQGIILPAEGEVQLANLINQAYRMSEDFVALGANATRDGRVEEAAEFERRAAQALHNAGMLTTRYFAAGSEAGRALRIRKEGLLTTDKLTEQAMRTIMDEQKLSQQAQEVLLKRVHDAKGDRGEILKALREAYIPTWWDKIMEYRTAVLLSSPVTLGRNVFGNTIALATRELEVVGGVPVDMLYGVLARGEKLGSDPSLGRRSPLEIGADMVGLGMGLKEGARLALKAFRDEDFAITRGRVGEEAVQVRTAIRGGPIQTGFGKVVRSTFRVLSAQDLLFSTAIKHADAYRLAMRHTINEGIIGPSRIKEAQRLATEALQVEQQRAKAFIQRPDAIETKAEEIAARSEASGLEFTFREQMSPFLKGLDRLRFQGGPGGRVFRFVMPFYATPMNIARFNIRRSPLTSFLSPHNKAQLFSGDRTQVVDAATRMLTGAAAFVPVMLLASEGYITGAGPDDRAARLQLEGQPGGWQAYSVRIAGQWYSYKGFSPMTEILALGSEFIERVMRGDAPAEDRVFKSLMLMMRTIIDQPFMTGVADLLEAVKADDEQGPVRVTGAASGAVGSFIPRGLAWLARAMDPTAREFRVDMGSRLKQQIPWWRNDALPLRDYLGRTHESANALLDSVVRTRGDKGTPLDNWLFEVKESVDDPVVRFPSRRFLGQPLLPEQYDQMLQYRRDHAIPRLENLATKRPLRAQVPDIQRNFIRSSVSAVDRQARDTLGPAFELRRLGMAETEANRKGVLRILHAPFLRAGYQLESTTDEDRIQMILTGHRP